MNLTSEQFYGEYLRYQEDIEVLEVQNAKMLLRGVPSDIIALHLEMIASMREFARVLKVASESGALDESQFNTAALDMALKMRAYAMIYAGDDE